MEFSPIPTEQTSAVTDILLMFLTAYLIFKLAPYSRGPGIRGKIWIGAFLCIGLASAMGAFVHGFSLSPEGERLGRIPVNLFVGLGVFCFAVGTAHDLLGDQTARKAMGFVMGLGLVVSLGSAAVPGAFPLLTASGAVILFFSLGSYGVLHSRRSLPGAGYIAAGVLVTIVGTLIQATRAVHFTFIWEFDHNGTLHLIQLPGLFLMLTGLLRGFAGRTPPLDVP